MNPTEFMSALMDGLSPLVCEERFVDARYSPGFVKGPGSVMVYFYNLPEKRVKEKRGGGAEGMNNRLLFNVGEFADESHSASKVTVEQLSGFVRETPFRKKTASPEKIASYLASYINKIASMYAPEFTHED